MNNDDPTEIKNMKSLENWAIKNFIDSKAISNATKNSDY